MILMATAIVILVLITIAMIFAGILARQQNSESTFETAMVFVSMLITSIVLIMCTLTYNYTPNKTLMDNNVTFDDKHYNAYRALNVKDK